MSQTVDLHIHTTASDGTVPPREAVELARTLDLAAIAVTDHDTVAGVGPALEAGAELGLEVIPGIEISADYGSGGVLILGLFIDPDSSALRPALEWALAERDRRNREIVDAMAADGIPISLDELRRSAPDATLGRPHMAQWLLDHGYTASVREGFDRYLGNGQRYYRPRRRIPLPDAVRCIRSAGGVAVIAHPYQYGFEDPAWEAFIRDAARAGCRALEAYYSGYSPDQTAALRGAAARYGLALSGGSDFHGARKPDIHMGSGVNGELAVPAGVLEGLRRQL